MFNDPRLEPGRFEPGTPGTYGGGGGGGHGGGHDPGPSPSPSPGYNSGYGNAGYGYGYNPGSTGSTYSGDGPGASGSSHGVGTSPSFASAAPQANQGSTGSVPPASNFNAPSVSLAAVHAAAVHQAQQQVIPTQGGGFNVSGPGRSPSSMQTDAPGWREWSSPSSVPPQPQPYSGPLNPRAGASPVEHLNTAEHLSTSPTARPVASGGVAPPLTPPLNVGQSAKGQWTLPATPGRNPNIAKVDPRLVEIMSAAAVHLPPGYKVTVNEGYNPAGHVSKSQHHIAGRGALDLQIWSPDGKPIPNKGKDVTGMYTALARHAYGEMLSRYPELKGKFAFGGAFGTTMTSGVPDLMHFDIGGDRGTLGPRVSDLGAMPGIQYGIGGQGAPATMVAANVPTPTLRPGDRQTAIAYADAPQATAGEKAIAANFNAGTITPPTPNMRPGRASAPSSTAAANAALPPAPFGADRIVRAAMAGDAAGIKAGMDYVQAQIMAQAKPKNADPQQFYPPSAKQIADSQAKFADYVRSLPPEVQIKIAENAKANPNLFAGLPANQRKDIETALQGVTQAADAGANIGGAISGGVKNIASLVTGDRPPPYQPEARPSNVPPPDAGFLGNLKNGLAGLFNIGGTQTATPPPPAPVAAAVAPGAAQDATVAAIAGGNAPPPMAYESDDRALEVRNADIRRQIDAMQQEDAAAAPPTAPPPVASAVSRPPTDTIPYVPPVSPPAAAAAPPTDKFAAMPMPRPAPAYTPPVRAPAPVDKTAGPAGPAGKLLVKAGYSLTNTKTNDAAMQAAIRDVQRKAGLPETGRTDKKTLKAIKALADNPPAPPAPVAATGVTVASQAKPVAATGAVVNTDAVKPGEFAEFSPAMQANAEKYPNVAAKLREMQEITRKGIDEQNAFAGAGRSAHNDFRDTHPASVPKTAAASKRPTDITPFSPLAPAQPAEPIPQAGGYGLPGGKEYPSFGEAVTDYGRQAAGAIQETLGIKPAEGATPSAIDKQVEVYGQYLEREGVTGAEKAWLMELSRKALEKANQ